MHSDRVHSNWEAVPVAHITCIDRGRNLGLDMDDRNVGQELGVWLGIGLGAWRMAIGVLGLESGMGFGIENLGLAFRMGVCAPLVLIALFLM